MFRRKKENKLVCYHIKSNLNVEYYICPNTLTEDEIIKITKQEHHKFIATWAESVRERLVENGVDVASIALKYDV